MKLLIINSAPNTRDFVAPIAEALAGVAIHYEITPYNDMPTDTDIYTGIIISASPQGNDIVAAHIPYFQWVRDTGIPVLGICHGHQVIGIMHGAELIRDTQSECGEQTLRIRENSPLFAGCGSSITVVSGHDNSITLPEGFTLLASSDRCRNQAMVHQEKPIYSVQFHAEKKPEIILNFIQIIS